jgi:hypothetical protein
MFCCALLQAKAVGSDFLWKRVQQLAPQMHVFGHSHFAWDAEIEGKLGFSRKMFRGSAAGRWINREFRQQISVLSFFTLLLSHLGHIGCTF